MSTHRQGNLSALEGDRSGAISLREYVSVYKSYRTDHHQPLMCRFQSPLHFITLIRSRRGVFWDLWICWVAELLYAVDCWDHRMDSKVKFLCRGLEKNFQRILYLSRKALLYIPTRITSDLARAGTLVLTERYLTSLCTVSWLDHLLYLLAAVSGHV